MSTNDPTGTTGVHRANGSSSSETASTDDATPDVAALQADIERTRADLADTVDQLTARLDVKTRVRHGVTEAKDNTAAQMRRLQDRATDADGRPTPAAALGLGVVVAATAVLAVVLVRRSSAPRRTRRRRS